jgi:hypothetical protein
MKTLTFRKVADKSGGYPAEGEPWPLSHVELGAPEFPGSEDLSNLPEEWEFTTNFIDRSFSEGWVRWEGDPFSYSIFPDPLGPFKGFSPTDVTLGGSVLAFDVVLRESGKRVTIRYKVVSGPIPHGWRQSDDSFPDGFRNDRGYNVTLAGHEEVD